MTYYEAHKAWLESLKAGDEVAVRYGPYGCRFATVERVTATQILVESDRFRRADGRQIGGSTWQTRRLEMPERAREEIAEREARKSVEEKRNDAKRRIERVVAGADLERLLEIERLIGVKREEGE